MPRRQRPPRTNARESTRVSVSRGSQDKENVECRRLPTDPQTTHGLVSLSFPYLLPRSLADSPCGLRPRPTPRHSWPGARLPRRGRSRCPEYSSTVQDRVDERLSEERRGAERRHTRLFPTHSQPTALSS